MDRHKSELHHSNWRMGEVLKADGPRIFQIETTLNNDTYPAPFDFLMKREWEWTRQGPGASTSARPRASSRTPPAMARKIFHSIRAPHRMTSVHAGAVDPGARGDAGPERQGAHRPRRGPDRRRHDGHPVHLPLQRQLDHEPDPRDVHGARVLLQHVPRASRSCARAAC